MFTFLLQPVVWLHTTAIRIYKVTVTQSKKVSVRECSFKGRPASGIKNWTVSWIMVAGQKERTKSCEIKLISDTWRQPRLNGRGNRLGGPIVRLGSPGSGLVLAGGSEDFKIRGIAFPSCRISHGGYEGCRCIPRSGRKVEGGRSKFRLASWSSSRGLWSSELLEALRLTGLMRRSRHLTERLPLWQLAGIFMGNRGPWESDGSGRWEFPWATVHGSSKIPFLDLIPFYCARYSELSELVLSTQDEGRLSVLASSILVSSVPDIS